MPRFYFLFLLLFVLSCSVDPLEVRTVKISEAGQDDGLEAITIDDLPATWTLTDEVLRAESPARLQLLPAHEALTLAFSFRADANTEASLILQGKYPLRLPELALSVDATRVPAQAVTPGVWQDLEVIFQPASGSSPALLAAVYLNGNSIHYQQPLPAIEAAAGPLQLELTAGAIELTDLRSIDRAGQTSFVNDTGAVELHLPIIQYAYYEIDGEPRDIRNWARLTPKKEGYIPRFDLNAIGERGSNWAARFTADLAIPQAGEYVFGIFSPASTRMYIDDQLVVDLGGRGEVRFAEDSIELAEGVHALRIDHYQYMGWKRLSLFYKDPDRNEGRLNDMPNDRNIRTPGGGEPMVVATDEEPYLLRSFLNFPPVRLYEESEKRTHVINVGEAVGPHYSYDLQRGSLLQAWRGQFVDVGKMWIERGEPQVAEALGPALAFEGLPQWYDDNDGWTDDYATVKHTHHELDETGRPTFYFEVDGQAVSDRIIPTGEGIQRTLTNAGSVDLYTYLAGAREIVETGPGSFELRSPGLKVEVLDYPMGGLVLQRGENLDRLVAAVPAGSSIEYTLNW